MIRVESKLASGGTPEFCCPGDTGSNSAPDLGAPDRRTDERLPSQAASRDSWETSAERSPQLNACAFFHPLLHSQQASTAAPAWRHGGLSQNKPASRKEKYFKTCMGFHTKVTSILLLALSHSWLGD